MYVHSDRVFDAAWCGHDGYNLVYPRWREIVNYLHTD